MEQQRPVTPSTNPAAATAPPPPPSSNSRDPFYRSSYVESTTLLGSSLAMPNRSAGQNLENPSYHRTLSPRATNSDEQVEESHEGDDDDADSQSLRKRTEMLKLAHIVSTFG